MPSLKYVAAVIGTWFCLLGSSIAVQASIVQSDESRLWDAVEKQDTTEVRAILDRHPEWVNSRLASDRGSADPLIHEAAREKNAYGVYFVQLLVGRGADVNQKGKSDKTALHHAVTAGNVETVRFLLSKGAKANAQDVRGWTPLHDLCSSIKSSAPEILRLLLAAGSDISLTAEGPDGLKYTPLTLARYSQLRLLSRGDTTPEINEYLRAQPKVVSALKAETVRKKPSITTAPTNSASPP